MTDIEKIVTDAKQTYTDIQSGDMTKVMADAAGLVSDFQTAKTDCMSHDSKKKLHMMFHKIRVTHRYADSATCMADVMKVVTDAEAVYADVQAKNVTKALADGETMVTDLK